MDVKCHLTVSVSDLINADKRLDMVLEHCARDSLYVKSQKRICQWGVTCVYYSNAGKAERR